MPLLEARNLSVYFPIYSGLLRKKVGEIKAVDDVSFSINQGEILGIVGESGSGKSTCARALTRLIEPTAGTIDYQGEDLLSYDALQLRAFRKDVQMVFQDPYASLNPRKSVLETIGEALEFHGLVTTKKEKIEAVGQVLEQVKLSPNSMDRYPHQFSGGQQQRICIGRALALQPKLIICDEAVSALDVSVQAQILNLLLELKESFHLNYLFISHDLSVVRYFCDAIVVFNEGKIVESGQADTLFRSPKEAYTQKLLAAIPATHPKERMPK